MRKFARLFDIKHGQLLVTLIATHRQLLVTFITTQDSDDGEKLWPMAFRVLYDEPFILEIIHSYLSEEDRLAQFEGLSDERAEKTATEMVRMGDRFMKGGNS